MKSFKKMKLVPIDLKQNSDQLLMPPAEKKLVQINDDMQNILSNRTLAKDKKLQLYYHALQNYINLHSKLSMPRRGKHIASYADSTDASSFDFEPAIPSSNSSIIPIPENDNYYYRTSTPIPRSFDNAFWEDDTYHTFSQPTNSENLISLPDYSDSSISIPQRPFDLSSPDFINSSKSTIPKLQRSRSPINRISSSNLLVNNVIDMVTERPEIFDYDERTNEVMYKGQRIPNTNINHIANYYLYGSEHKPEGIEIFNTAVEELARRPHTDSIAIYRKRFKPNRKRNIVELRRNPPLKKKLRLVERSKRKFSELKSNAQQLFPNKKQKLSSSRVKWIKH